MKLPRRRPSPLGGAVRLTQALVASANAFVSGDNGPAVGWRARGAFDGIVVSTGAQRHACAYCGGARRWQCCRCRRIGECPPQAGLHQSGGDPGGGVGGARGRVGAAASATAEPALADREPARERCRPESESGRIAEDPEVVGRPEVRRGAGARSACTMCGRARCRTSRCRRRLRRRRARRLRWQRPVVRAVVVVGAGRVGR